VAPARDKALERGGMTGRPRFPIRWDVAVLTLIFSFLYLPILIVVVFSFNDSRLVTVWAGFSTRWYGSLLSNRPLLDAAVISVQIGLLSALIATVLGTWAAIALTRLGPFRGRAFLGAMVYAPLVMPEIITGLSLLLLFVAIGLDRGFWTITLAHATFSMCFVTVLVQARLVTLDRSLEEAAQDLGCSPFAAFWQVTLPLISTSVASGFLLALTLSLDDLVVASFVSGPGATTLPMRIYGQARLGVTPEINAICSVLIGLVTLAVLAATVLTKRDFAARRGP
jgi:putrescine transport system permease protein